MDQLASNRQHGKHTCLAFSWWALTNEEALPEIAPDPFMLVRPLSVAICPAICNLFPDMLSPYCIDFLEFHYE